MVRSNCLLLVVLLGVVGGCSEPPPAAPFVDPVTSPTSLLTQDITGYAKWGSTVTIAGGAQTGTGIADPYVGRFKVTVQLTPMSTNTLNVTAADASGTSEATVVTIVTPAPGQTISMLLSSPAMKAGSSVTATVTVLDANGDPTGMAIAPTVSGPTGNGAVTVSGTGTASDPFTLSGTKAGVYTLTAALPNGASATATLTVLPADPTMPPDLHLRLASNPSGADATNVAAGTQLVYVYSQVDPYGNNLPLPPVTVTTNMPGATVSPVDTQTTGASGVITYQGFLLNFVRSGTFLVNAYLAGTSLTQSRTITVGTDTTSLVAHITLGNNITPISSPLSYQVVVKDGFGNNDTASLSRLSLSFNPTSTPAQTCSPSACTAPAASGTLNFPTAGTYQVSANFLGTPAVTGDSAYVSAINVPVPPTLTIYTPTATDLYRPGDFIAITIQSHTNTASGGTVAVNATGVFGASSLVSVGQDVCASGAAGCAPLLSIRVPVAATFGVETVLVVVTDSTTGASITKSVSFTIDTVQIVPSGGRIATIVARAGRLNNPMGLTTFPAAGTDLYIANNANNEVLKVNLGGALPVQPSNGNIFATALASPSEVQLRPDGAALGTYPPAAFQGLYIGNDGGFFLRTTDSGGAVTVTGLANINGLAYQAVPVPAGAGLTPRLFGVDDAADRVRVRDPVSFADLTGGTSPDPTLNNPWGMLFYTSAGSTKVVVSNTGNRQIRVCDIGIGMPATWATSCTATRTTIADSALGDTLNNARGLAMTSPTATKLYVASRDTSQILMYDLAVCAAGTCAESIIATGFMQPIGLTFDAAGNLYVSDEGLDLIVRIAPNGTPF